MNCEVCEKKIKLSSYPCKCEKYFCKEHFVPESHMCSYNYKEEHKKKIYEKNPIIIPVKI